MKNDETFKKQVATVEHIFNLPLTLRDSQEHGTGVNNGPSSPLTHPNQHYCSTSLPMKLVVSSCRFYRRPWTQLSDNLIRLRTTENIQADCGKTKTIISILRDVSLLNADGVCSLRDDAGEEQYVTCERCSLYVNVIIILTLMMLFLRSCPCGSSPSLCLQWSLSPWLFTWSSWGSACGSDPASRSVLLGSHKPRSRATSLCAAVCENVSNN